MTMGIYCIEHVASEKKYIGKSRHIENRFSIHKSSLKRAIRYKDCNRHLYNAVQKYGLDAFRFYVLEEFFKIDENEFKDRELFWMDFYKTCDRQHGYNLRRDSSTNTIVANETLKLMSEIFTGKSNPNFGNRWNKNQKQRMSVIAKERHASGKYYNEITKKLHSESSKKLWQDKNKRNQMAMAVSKAKEKYDFYQYHWSGQLIKIWLSVKDIIKENPTYKWQNIYSVCNGYKPTYMGYTWKKKLKNSN